MHHAKDSLPLQLDLVMLLLREDLIYRHQRYELTLGAAYISLNLNYACSRFILRISFDLLSIN